jgi:CubicO group peptidase (beta-lactamase class C family)
MRSRLASIGAELRLGCMMRKLALAAALPLLLASTGPRIEEGVVTAQQCPGLDLRAAKPALDRLVLDHPETRGVMLVVDGCPAWKQYGPGYSDANRLISWSMAKTVTAMLVGQLVADGRLALDAPAPVAEWRKPGDPRAAITLRHLLTMSSGLAHVEVGDPIERSDTNQVLFVSGTGTMAARAIAQPLVHRPGTVFEYSSLTSIILAEIVARTLTVSRDPHERARAYRAFAQQRLFAPAGVTSAFLEFDGAGTQIGGSLMHMTLPDWARLGRLLIDGRSDGGRQVLAPGWVAAMKAPSAAYPGYGLQTWLNHPGGAEPGLFPGKGPIGTAGMRGHLGQFTVAARGTGRDGREYDVVLVRLGHTDGAKLDPVLAQMGSVVDALIPAGGARPPSR